MWVDPEFPHNKKMLKRVWTVVEVRKEADEPWSADTIVLISEGGGSEAEVYPAELIRIPRSKVLGPRQIKKLANQLEEERSRHHDNTDNDGCYIPRLDELVNCINEWNLIRSRIRKGKVYTRTTLAAALPEYKIVDEGEGLLQIHGKYIEVDWWEEWLGDPTPLATMVEMFLPRNYETTHTELFQYVLQGDPCRSVPVHLDSYLYY